MKIEALGARKLLFEVDQGNRHYEIEIEPYLRYAGIQSMREISEIRTSEFFPPEKYSNTGRTPCMPSNYMCMRSASYEFLMMNGEERALSLALFHDITRHRGTSEANAWILGWPVGIVHPASTREVRCHSLFDDQPITVTMARGLEIERRIVVKPPTSP